MQASPDQFPHTPPDSVLRTTGPLPGFGRSLGWLLVFMAVFFVAVIVYVMGYSITLGVEYAAQGITQPDPAEIEMRIQAHLTSPSGIAGLYAVQCLLLLPVIILAAHFPRQPWQQTLGFHRFDRRSLVFWLVIFGLAREKSGSIWVPLIVHSLNNAIAAITVIYLGLL